MAVANLLKNSFSAGELSPLMLARTDFARYPAGAKTLENWIVLLQGGVRTRFGTRYVATVRESQRLTIVRPFEASGDDVYIIEMGHLYFRFFKDGAPILDDDDDPIEVVTPYEDVHLRNLRTAQANDVLIIASPDHAPRQLSRLSDTEWSLQEIIFDSPPLYEAGFSPVASLTPSAVSGSITLTSAPGVFLRTDVDRQIQAGQARAVITAYTSATQVTATVLSPFPDTDPLGINEWTMLGEPVAILQPEKAAPVGALIVMDLRLEQPGASELISDGDFATIGAWVDMSGPVLATGEHDGGNGSASRVIDASQDFVAAGVLPGHVVENITDGSHAIVDRTVGIDSVRFDADGLQGGTGNVFDDGDDYEIRGTGGISVHDGKLFLNGNTHGTASARRAITTVVGITYRVEFDVSEGPISAMVGSAAGLGDLAAEATYEIGNDRFLTFNATTTTSHIHFRNNQQVTGAVDNVSAKQFSADGWRDTDVGRYVQVHGGLVKITSYASATRVVGQILHELSTDDAALPGTWKLSDPSWSTALGYPSVCCFFEGRLYFAGSERFPQTIWASAVDDFFSFFLGPEASDAIEMNIVDSAGNITLNLIRWLMPGENLLAGTTHAEYRLTGPAEGAFSAIDLPLVRVQSTFGSAAVQPVRVGQSLLFAQRQGSKVRQIASEPLESSAFLARDLTILSGHLLEGDHIHEMSFAAEPIPIITSLRSDGQLLFLTYDVLEEVIAWSRMVTEGEIDAHAIIPHPTANTYQMWMVVSRTIEGELFRFIEYVDDQSVMTALAPVNGVIPTFRGLTLDSAITYAFGSPSDTLTGLDHLEGATVKVVGDGAVFPEQVVYQGQITLPHPVTTAWAGLPYTCTGETLPLDLMLRQGTVQDNLKDWKKLFIRVYQTTNLVINGERIAFRTPNMPMGQGVAQFTGKKEIVPPGTGWDLDATITFVQDQPLPATVLSISGGVDIGGM